MPIWNSQGQRSHSISYFSICVMDMQPTWLSQSSRWMSLSPIHASLELVFLSGQNLETLVLGTQTSDNRRQLSRAADVTAHCEHVLSAGNFAATVLVHILNMRDCECNWAGWVIAFSRTFYRLTPNHLIPKLPRALGRTSPCWALRLAPACASLSPCPWKASIHIHSASSMQREALAKSNTSFNQDASERTWS